MLILGVLDVGNGFKPLEDPLISIGKNDTALDIKPTSLRFWEKLGLTPKSGPKDFTGFVLFEDDTGQKQPYIERWLTGVKNVYHVGLTMVYSSLSVIEIILHV